MKRDATIMHTKERIIEQPDNLLKLKDAGTYLPVLTRGRKHKISKGKL